MSRCRLAGAALAAGLAIAAAPGTAPSPAPASDQALLERVDDVGWREVLAGHRGEIVVVDFWASWCLPCLDRFPHMVELSESHADDGVRFIAFSLDDVEDEGAMRFAERFAKEQGGRIEHYVTSESIPAAFEKLGLLGIPAVYLYDREGHLARRLTTDDPNDQFTEEDVEAAILELLGER